MSPVVYLGAVLLLSSAVGAADNTTSDACLPQPGRGPWSAALEDWVTADRVTLTRHGRIMSLAPSQGYYVSDRIDLTPPPPPPHHMQHRGPYPAHQSGPYPTHQSGPYPAHQSGSYPEHQSGSYPAHQPGAHHGPPSDHNQPESQRLQNQPAPARGPPAESSAPMPYDEWQATPPPPPGAGKIVNRPPNPYKDQFKPSYPPPSPPQPIPVHGGLSDRVDEQRPPANKQVSETDLYLLGAIEKLVYRVDLMEKRLRKMEENVHYLVVGAEAKPEPCMSNFTRVGKGCYHFSTDALNWKNANYACRKLKGYLLELDVEERRPFTSSLLADKNLKGVEFWTGGLNPGLLWIWSHSAAAVGNNTAGDVTIVGEGRCLALVHDPASAAFVFRGQDCALRHRYVCERDGDKTKLGNEIERVARELRLLKRAPKMKWADDLP